MRRYPVILAAVFLALSALVLCAPLAFADEPSSTSSSSSTAADYTELLESIDGKLDGLASAEDLQGVNEALGNMPTADDVKGLREVIQDSAPADNRQRIEALNEFMGALTTLTLFQWVTLLLLLGVVCALVFLVSYRSHT